MKKFIAIAVFSFALCSLHAQTVDKQGTLYTYSTALDTNTNAVTSYAYIKGAVGKVQSFQFTVTKISGTVGGTVILEGSNDGVGWVNTFDTLTLANQALNTNGWLNIGDKRWKQYRGRYTTTGTQVSSLQFTLVTDVGKLTTE